MKNTIQAKQRKKAAKAAEPHVGIFWLVDGKLLIDSTALGKAEAYGEFKIHSGDHISVWAELQQNGTAPSDMEYEEAPRGRVMYNTRTRRFTFLADRCILGDKGVVRKIMSAMNLPVDTQADTDSHYRCFRCLRGR
jgi:hypothetical protein